ncbi:MAG: transcription termination factor Rho [Lachnospiraceae bacterium]|nr:transcription termination factor Rho [Lachnospiraceae bacterium]
MREKYETLELKDLKEIAKIRGIKGITKMDKAAIIDAMVAKDAEDAAAPAAQKSDGEEKKTVKKAKTSSEKKTAKSVKTEEEKNSEDLPAEKKVEEENPEVKANARRKKAKETDNDEETAGNDDKAKPAKKTSSKGASAAETKAPENVNGAEDESSPALTTSDASENKNEAASNNVNDSEKPSNKRVVVRTTRKSDKPENGQGDGEKNETTAYEKNESEKAEAYEVRPEARIYGKTFDKPEDADENLDSGVNAHGILEVMPEGYGFIRCDNFLPGADDVYVAPGQIRKFGLKTGDIIDGNKRIKTQNEKFSALLYLRSVNGYSPEVIKSRGNFEDMTPIFPDHRIRLETPGSSVAMRVMDLLSPVGKGQRGMIVSPPKAGKTTLLKEVAKSVKRNNPEIHMIILLIDERPEEVTDIKEAIEGPNVEVIYSTFDELPEHHKRVSEMVIERAKRLVEHHKDVMILLDSITRLTRAYNLTVPPSGRTLSGGLDPAALHMPKRFFGAARNMREGGSLTILATALVETGSKMDDVVYEEFKGTGNMEMVLDRKLSERRIFPAIDIAKSGTRRDDLLLTPEEIGAVNSLRKGINGLKPEETVDRILDMFSKTRGNQDFIHMVNKIHIF